MTTSSLHSINTHLFADFLEALLTEWGFYAGPGVAIGASPETFNVGIAGQVGLEYTFHFPLQLSVDLRPQLGVVNQAFGIWGWYPHLSVRYRF